MTTCSGTNQTAPDARMRGRGAVASMKGTCPVCGYVVRTSVTGRVLPHQGGAR